MLVDWSLFRLLLLPLKVCRLSDSSEANLFSSVLGCKSGSFYLSCLPVSKYLFPAVFIFWPIPEHLRWPTLISVAQRSAHCRHSAL